MASSSEPAAGLDFTTFYNVVDGKLVSTSATRHGVNPATEKPNPMVPVATRADVDTAVAAGLRAFGPWSRKTTYAERQQLLLRFADALEANKDSFIEMLVREQGKPRHFAGVEFNFSVRTLRDFAKLELPTKEIVEGDLRILVRHVPLGLAVGIVPWNFPLLLACAKIAPAVLTGNTIIIKPSPFTPYCGLKVVELAQRFFPAGVVQALSGDDNLGPWLTSHPGPAKVSFTGSTATGKKVMESASSTLKRLTLELGGNDPAIICDDVDIDATAKSVVESCFLNAGQLCLAIKRIYVQKKIYEPFRAALAKEVQKLNYGPGTEEGNYLGPVQNKMQYERVKTFFDDIQRDNLAVAAGGNGDGVIGSKPGYFIPPTIVDRPDPKARIVVEEPFGPILPLLTYETDDEAIALANDTDFGLGASVWSSNAERANGIAEQIEAGTVWVNRHYYLDVRVPYGGFKQSGMGVEFGEAGLTSFCNSQTLYFEN